MSEKTYKLTPLGAAVCEALPDRKMVSKINRDFKRMNVCPMSEIFDHQAILDYYDGTITPMPQHLYRAKR